MAFSSLIPFALLLFVPGLILLYILKQNASEQQVSSVSLWREAFKNLQARKPWEKFKKSILFFLQLMILLLLIFLLASPYLKKGGKAQGHIIIGIDVSGSMKGLYDDEESRLMAAKARAKAYVEQSTGNNVFSVVSIGNTSQILLTVSKDTIKVKNTIAHLEATDAMADMSSGINLLRTLASRQEGCQVVLFTDSDVDIQDLPATVVDLSPVTKKAKSNVAVDYLNHTITEDGRADILAHITNYGSDAVSGELNLYMEDELLQVQEYTLEAGESKGIYFESLSQAKTAQAAKNKKVLRCEKNEPDAIAADDEAWDFLDAKEQKKVLLVTKQNVFLEKAVNTVPQVTLQKAGNIKQVDDATEYDLYIYDGVAPEQLPEKGNILFIAPSETVYADGKALFSVEGKSKNEWINTCDHKVTQYLKDYEFGVSKMMNITKPEWAESFFDARDFSAGFMGEVKGRTVAVLAFDLHQTDFPLQTEFPVFMYQLIQNCLEGQLLSANLLTAGDDVSLLFGEEKEAVITSPNSEKTKLSASSSLYTGAVYEGEYQVDVSDGKEKIKERFFASLPSSESQIKEKIQVTSGAKEIEQVQAEKLTGQISLKIPLLFVIIFLLLLEWWVYVRQT